MQKSSRRSFLQNFLITSPAGVLAPPAGAMMMARPPDWAAVVTYHHGSLAQILDELILADEWSTGSALALSQKLRYQVTAHLVGEETVLYPAAVQHGLADASDSNHPFLEHAKQKLGTALLEFEITAKNETGARRTAQLLRDEIVGHSKEEDTGVYLRLRKELDGTGNAVLGTEYRRAFSSVRPAKVKWLPG